MCLECNICKAKYVFRISIGYGLEQRHFIKCDICNEEIGVTLKLDQENASIETYFTNCVQTEECGTAKVYNLSADFIVPEKYQNQEFISIPLIQKDLFANAEEVARLSDSERAKLRRTGTLLAHIDKEWLDIKFCLSQYIMGSKRAFEIAKMKAGKYDSNSTPPEWLFDFGIRLLHHNEIYVRAIIAKIKNLFNTLQGNDFLKYHDSVLFKVNMKQYNDVFKSFFQSYSLFNPLLFCYRNNKEISKGSLSTFEFDSIKKFYGDAFECLGTAVDTYALLANMLKGRKFDEFETLTLKKYQTDINKSSKINCFHDIDEFKNAILSYDNKIRNGSHHNSMEYDPATQLISYSPKELSTKETIHYFDYMDVCVRIFISCNVLFCVDLFLHYMSKMKNRKS